MAKILRSATPQRSMPGAESLVTLNLWQRVVPPAPRPTLVACIPEVMPVQVARQCMPRLYDTSQQVEVSSLCRALCFVCLIACSGLSHVWSLCSTSWNKLMHIANGNMGKSGKGKGKAVFKGQEKGKSSSREPGSNERNEQDANDVAAAVRMVLPEAARIRMQSTLMQSEWPVPVHIHQTLSSQGGIALVPKEYIAEVIGRVGYTSHPTAIAITQDPDTLGLTGYVRHRIRCTVRHGTGRGAYRDTN